MRRNLFIAFVVAYLCGTSAACKTTVGGGQVRAESANKELDSVVDVLDKLKDQVATSKATPEEKKAMNDGIERAKGGVKFVQPQVTQLGKDTDHNQEIAISNEAKSRATNLVVLILVCLAIIGLVIWRIQANKPPPINPKT